MEAQWELGDAKASEIAAHFAPSAKLLTPDPRIGHGRIGGCGNGVLFSLVRPRDPNGGSALHEQIRLKHMLDKALGLIVTQLNQYLRHRFQLNEELARLSSLLEQDGCPVPQSLNKVVVFLAGIESNDKSPQVIGADARDPAQRGSLSLPKWNLLVMCAANFDGNSYPEALKFLSSTIQFFHDFPMLNQENTPSIDPQLSKLLLNIQDMPATEVESLWNIHNNGRYLPSVICRVQVFGSKSEL